MTSTASRHHTLDIYGAELWLCTSRRQWSSLRRRLTFLDKAAPEAAGLSQFATFVPKHGGPTVPHVVLWIDPRQARSDAELVDTCAHEASHAAGQLLDYIGHDIRGTDEPHAYLVGWLTRWLWETVRPELGV
jgi:hypothetical protein